MGFMATHGLPIENVDALIYVFTIAPFVLCILADKAPGEWRYLYKFVFTLTGLLVNLFLFWEYLPGNGVMDVVNGATFEFWELGSIFLVIASLYAYVGVVNIKEFYQYHLEPEMNI
jgi:hypothetical protein